MLKSCIFFNVPERNFIELEGKTGEREKCVPVVLVVGGFAGREGGGQSQRLWSGRPASADRDSPLLSWRRKCTLFITYISLAIKAWAPAKPNSSSVPESNALFDMWWRNHRGLCRVH